MTRPKDGVQHPDLDAAWAKYDKRIEAVAKAIEDAIERALNEAAAAGDLDAALKWKAAGERFRMDGRIPEGLDGEKAEGKPKPKPQKPETLPQSRIAEAQKYLATSYDAVEKSLVKSRDLERAQQVRAERDRTAITGQPGADRNPNNVEIVIEAKDYARSIPGDKGLRAAPAWEGLTVPAKAELIWEIDVAAAGEQYLHVLYASEQLRPCAITLNGKRVSAEALAKITGGFMTKDLRWETLGPFGFRRGRNLLSIKPDVVGPHLSRMVISASKEPPVSEVP